jgi:hypothetical protein
MNFFKEPLTRLHLACFLFGAVVGLFLGPQILLSYACHYTDSRTGADIIGECGWVSEQRELDAAPSTLPVNVQRPAEFVVPSTSTLAVMSSSTTTTTIISSICEDCVCPTCFDVNATLRELKALRPDIENSAAQFGWQRMRAKCMDLIDDSRDYHYVLAPGLHTTPTPNSFNESFYYFQKDDGGFWLNRTPDEFGRIMWSWDSSQCLNSALWVYKAA